MKSNKYLKICLLISLSLLIIGFNTAIAADSGNAINKTSVKSSHLNKDSSTDNAYKINKKIQNNTKNTNKKTTNKSPTITLKTPTTTTTKTTIKLSAKIKNETTINSGYVSYFVNNKFIDKVESKRGKSTINYTTNSTAGKYKIKAKYVLDKNVLCSITNNMTVYDKDTTIKISAPKTIQERQNININVKVLRKGVKVKTGKVAIYFDDKLIDKEDIKKGYVSIEYLVPLVTGSKTIQCYYINDNNVKTATNYTKIKVKPSSYTMTIQSLDEALRNEIINLTVNIKHNGIANVNKGKVSLYLDNKYLKTMHVHNSKASMIYTYPDTIGNYTFTVYYKSENNISVSKKTKDFEVNVIRDIIDLSSNGTYVAGLPITIKAHVYNTAYNQFNTGKVKFTLDDETLKIVKVKNGFAQFNYQVPLKLYGNHSLKAIYINDENKETKLKTNGVLNIKTPVRMTFEPTSKIKVSKTTTWTVNVYNNTGSTLNSGKIIFKVNNKIVASVNVKNNKASYTYTLPYKEDYYFINVSYYDSNNHLLETEEKTIETYNPNKQIYLELSNDLINNSKTTSTKKDVYIAMDRTTSSVNYSPGDMTLMNNVASKLKAEGFNVKKLKNGPQETYNVAMDMYYANVKDSICLIICNGVDANVIREYFMGKDNRITAIRKRGNDIVMAWFYGAGDFYNPTGKYYTYLPKAWDDHYSRWGGMSYPRKAMEEEGIKIIYHQNDYTGNQVAESFVKMYGTNITSHVEVGTVLKLKTHIYYRSGNVVNSGEVTYYINNNKIGTQSVKNGVASIQYKVPYFKDNYKIKVEYNVGSIGLAKARIVASYYPNKHLFIDETDKIIRTNINDWIDNKISDVYVQCNVQRRNSTQLKKIISYCKSENIRVHALISCFKLSNNKWSVTNKQQKSVINYIEELSTIKYLSGICLDYLCYNGTNNSEVNSTLITNFVNKVNSTLANSNLSLTACLCNNTEISKKKYGQDLSKIGKYFETILPMRYSV